MSDVIQKVRERLANNGRNTANSNRGIPVGSDLHLCEMLLAEIADTAAFLDRLADWLDTLPRVERFVWAANKCRAEAAKLRGETCVSENSTQS